MNSDPVVESEALRRQHLRDHVEKIAEESTPKRAKVLRYLLDEHRRASRELSALENKLQGAILAHNMGFTKP